MAYSPSDLNKLFLDCAQHVQKSLPHLRVQTAVIATADANSDASAIALINSIRTTLIAHFSDAYVAATGLGAHVIVDPNTVTTGAASLFNDVYTLENDCRQRFNSHTEHASHVFPDAAGKVVLPSSADNGTNAAVYQRVNLLKAAINVHLGKTSASAAAA